MKRDVRDASDALAYLWNVNNCYQFDCRLSQPIFRWSLAGGDLGSWSPAGRVLAISERCLALGWDVLEAVLRHEMAHQYCDEVLKVSEAPHGPVFRRVCAERGIDAAAEGVPTISSDTSPISRKIRALLALAGSPEEHEAAAAMNAARRLMLKHNLAGLEDERRFVSRFLGHVRHRLPLVQRSLAELVSTHFFVQGVWVLSFDAEAQRMGSVLEISGTPENLEMAVYAYEFLDATLARLWASRRAQLGRGGVSEKRAYQLGILHGFSAKLVAAEGADAETGLVWSGDPALQAYMDFRFPKLQSGLSRRARLPQEAYHAGVAAGGEVTLHRPIAEGPSARKGAFLLEG